MEKFKFASTTNPNVRNFLEKMEEMFGLEIIELGPSSSFSLRVDCTDGQNLVARLQPMNGTGGRAHVISYRDEEAIKAQQKLDEETAETARKNAEEANKNAVGPEGRRVGLEGKAEVTQQSGLDTEKKEQQAVIDKAAYGSTNLDEQVEAEKNEAKKKHR